MNSIARSSNQSNNQSNSNNNGVATTSNDASRRGYQPFDRNSAMMTGARRSGSANHSSAMAATASWISSLPSNNPNTNADPVNNLASAFSILNDDEIVRDFKQIFLKNSSRICLFYYYIPTLLPFNL